MAHSAFAKVSGALDAFAEALEAAQQRMRGVKADAEAAYQRLQSAQSAKESLREPSDEAKEADPAAQSRYESAKSDASSRVSGASAAFDEQLRLAGSLRAQVQEASARQAAVIRTAGRESPTSGQNWFSDKTEKAGRWVDENLGGLRDWIGEHAGVLRGIASAMRVVGIALAAVGAVIVALGAVASLTGIGALAGVPGMGVGMAMVGAGFGLMGAADTMDTAVDWGEGKIDGQQLVVEGLTNGAISVLSLAGVGVLAQGAKQAFKHMPESWQRKADDWLSGLWRHNEKRPDVPGWNRPLAGGTADNPVPFPYTSRTLELHKVDPPTRADLRTADADAPTGSAAKTYATWVERAKKSGWNPLDADQYLKWREGYAQKLDNLDRGTPFERLFEERNPIPEGWQRQEPVVVPGSATDRRFDLASTGTKSALELKSGGTLSGTVNSGEFGNDVRLIERSDWSVHYVFGQEPQAETLRLLEAAKDRLARTDPQLADKLTWEVWHTVQQPHG